MYQRVKDVWLTGLRSDEFMQIKGSLCGIVEDQPRYCCLGVLCELYRRENPDKAIWTKDAEFKPVFPDHDANACCDDFCDICFGISYNEYLPPVVMQWAGIEAENPQLGDHDAGTYNDGDPVGDPPIPAKSFAEIADLIEEHL